MKNVLLITVVSLMALIACVKQEDPKQLKLEVKNVSYVFEGTISDSISQGIDLYRIVSCRYSESGGAAISSIDVICSGNQFPSRAKTGDKIYFYRTRVGSLTVNESEGAYVGIFIANVDTAKAKIIRSTK